MGAAARLRAQPGGAGVGVTLSSAQATACRRHGLDVHVLARSPMRASARSTRWRALAPSSTSARPRTTAPTPGRDLSPAVRTGGGLLPAGGRFYLQTMAFGPRMIPIDEVDLALRAAPTRGTALMGRQFPGSFLPSARIRSSRRPCRRPGWSRAPAAARLHRDDPPVAQAVRRAEREEDAAQAPAAPRWLTSSDFRLAFTSGVSANSVCFERELLDHHRIVFEKVVRTVGFGPVWPSSGGYS